MNKPLPEVTPLNERYWGSLREAAVLVFQSCGCGHRWLPPRRFCPRCLGDGWRWVESSGSGLVVSWVVYRTAYHESFSGELPYNVTLVELDEGPRLITNIVDCPDGSRLAAGARVTLAVQYEQGFPLARFRLAGDATT